MTNREKAITLLAQIVNEATNVPRDLVVEVVDALIAAARDPESPHSRAVDQMAAPLAPGTYRDGVGLARCHQCHRIHPCQEHYTHPARPLVDQTRAEELRGGRRAGKSALHGRPLDDDGAIAFMPPAGGDKP